MRASANAKLREMERTVESRIGCCDSVYKVCIFWLLLDEVGGMGECVKSCSCGKRRDMW